MSVETEVECPYQAMEDRVILSLVEEPSTSPSGLIYVPDMAKDAPQTGRIISIGPDVIGPYTEGDIIVFGKYSGATVKHQGAEFLIIKAEDILAKVAK